MDDEEPASDKINHAVVGADAGSNNKDDSSNQEPFSQSGHSAFPSRAASSVHFPPQGSGGDGAEIGQASPLEGSGANAAAQLSNRGQNGANPTVFAGGREVDDGATADSGDQLASLSPIAPRLSSPTHLPFLELPRSHTSDQNEQEGNEEELKSSEPSYGDVSQVGHSSPRAQDVSQLLPCFATLVDMYEHLSNTYQLVSPSALPWLENLCNLLQDEPEWNNTPMPTIVNQVQQSLLQCRQAERRVTDAVRHFIDSPIASEAPSDPIEAEQIQCLVENRDHQRRECLNLYQRLAKEAHRRSCRQKELERNLNKLRLVVPSLSLEDLRSKRETEWSWFRESTSNGTAYSLKAVATFQAWLSGVHGSPFPEESPSSLLESTHTAAAIQQRRTNAVFQAKSSHLCSRVSTVTCILWQDGFLYVSDADSTSIAIYSVQIDSSSSNDGSTGAYADASNTGGNLSGVDKGSLEGHEGSVWDLKCSDEGILVSASHDATLRSWSTETKSCIHVFRGHRSSVMSVAICGQWLLSGSHDDTIRQWDLWTGRCYNIFEDLAGGLWALAACRLPQVSGSKPKRMFYVGCGSSIQEWKLSVIPNETVPSGVGFEGHEDTIWAVCVAHSKLYSASGDETVRVWEQLTGKQLKVLRAHTESVTCLEIHKEEYLFSGSDDQTVILWDLVSDKPLRVFNIHDDGVSALHVGPAPVNPNSQSTQREKDEESFVLYTGSYDNTVKAIHFSLPASSDRHLPDKKAAEPRHLRGLFDLRQSVDTLNSEIQSFTSRLQVGCFAAESVVLAAHDQHTLLRSQGAEDEEDKDGRTSKAFHDSVEKMCEVALRDLQEVMDTKAKTDALSADLSNLRSLFRKERRGLRLLQMEEDEEGLTPHEISEIRGRIRRQKERVQEIKRQVESTEKVLGDACGVHFPELVPDCRVFEPKWNWLQATGFVVDRRLEDDYEHVGPLSLSQTHLKAVLKGTETPVVLKRVPISDEKLLRNEIYLTQKLKHPQIVEIDCIFLDDENVYLQMEWEGLGTLSEWVQKEERDPGEVRAVFRQVLQGLAYIHSQQIVHCQLRPDSILLAADGFAKLCNFGISSRLPTVPRHKDSVFQAPPTIPSPTSHGFASQPNLAYAAPEVLQGGKATAAADLYSFGLMLFEWEYRSMNTSGQDYVASQLGKTAVSGSPPDITAPDHSDSNVQSLLSSLLSQCPDKRLSASEALSHPVFRAAEVHQLRRDKRLVERDTRIDLLRQHLRLLRAGKEAKNPDVVRIEVDRDTIVSDVLHAFRDGQALDKEGIFGRLFVTFGGESAVDVGGVTKDLMTEFFQKVCDPNLGLFERVFEDEQVDLYLPRAQPEETDGDSHLSLLRAVGRVMFKSLLEEHPIFAPFAPIIYEYLLPNMRINFDHPEDCLIALKPYSSMVSGRLRMLLEAPNAADWGIHDDDGAVVTNETRNRYVCRYVYDRLIGRRLKQLQQIREGFLDGFACPDDFLTHFSLLSPSDLMVVMAGHQYIDAEMVISQLEFRQFGVSNTPRLLMEWLRSLEASDLRRFLRFVTSTSTIPFGGFTKKIRIHNSTKLFSHTCFNELECPPYPTREELQEKLTDAILAVDVAGLVDVDVYEHLLGAPPPRSDRETSPRSVEEDSILSAGGGSSSNLSGSHE